MFHRLSLRLEFHRCQHSAANAEENGRQIFGPVGDRVAYTCRNSMDALRIAGARRRSAGGSPKAWHPGASKFGKFPLNSFPKNTTYSSSLQNALIGCVIWSIIDSR
jgi:hypothetical protein